MREEIVRWNNRFPLDRWWRKKYSLAYNSQLHQEISQLDIFFEWFEDEIFKDYEHNQELFKEKEEKLKNGELLTSRSVESEEQEFMFDSLDLSQLNI